MARWRIIGRMQGEWGLTAVHEEWSKREKAGARKEGEQQAKNASGTMTEEDQRAGQQSDEGDDQESQECSALAHGKNHFGGPSQRRAITEISSL